MVRYFKIIEIDRNSFVHETGEDLECSQLVVPTRYAVYAAVNENDESDLSVPMDSFDYPEDVDE